MNKLKVRGEFVIEHFRKGSKIGEHKVKNGVTNAGLDALLDIMFHASSQISTWYIGLVDNSGWTAFAAADTMSSHSGWTELEDYDEANRVEWTEGAASSQQITNATPLTFTMNATNVVKGIFVASESTKGGTSGTLWSTGAFTSTISVEDDDLIKITYTITAANA